MHLHTISTFTMTRGALSGNISKKFSNFKLVRTFMSNINELMIMTHQDILKHIHPHFTVTDRLSPTHQPHPPGMFLHMSGNGVHVSCPHMAR